MSRPSVQARGIHIASRNGDDNNNDNDDNECQRRGLVHSQAHGIFISRRAKATTTTTIGDNKQQVLDNKALCASAQHIHIASRDGGNDNGNEDDERRRQRIHRRGLNASARYISHCAQAHMLCIKHRCPHAQAHQVFSHCAEAHKLQCHQTWTQQSTGDVKHRRF
jgi:hypothetical protein